jgi:sulfate transport system substrate-binding protein
VFETGGRGATTAFTERELGDVLITFEAEVHGIRKLLGEDKYDAVVPEVSLLAEFPVAVVDKVADARGSQEIATEYLNYLYSPAGQEILATFFNRVHDEAVVAAHAESFPEVRLLTVEEVFGGWDKVSTEHFAEGGLLDKVFLNQ